jgi:hypothetical protein
MFNRFPLTLKAASAAAGTPAAALEAVRHNAAAQDARRSVDRGMVPPELTVRSEVCLQGVSVTPARLLPKRLSF